MRPSSWRRHGSTNSRDQAQGCKKTHCGSAVVVQGKLPILTHHGQPSDKGFSLVFGSACQLHRMDAQVQPQQFSENLLETWVIARLKQIESPNTEAGA